MRSLDLRADSKFKTYWDWPIVVLKQFWFYLDDKFDHRGQVRPYITYSILDFKFDLRPQVRPLITYSFLDYKFDLRVPIQPVDLFYRRIQAQPISSAVSTKFLWLNSMNYLFYKLELISRQRGRTLSIRSTS
jgi:hypothetical protein